MLYPIELEALKTWYIIGYPENECKHFFHLFCIFLAAVRENPPGILPNITITPCKINQLAIKSHTAYAPFPARRHTRVSAAFRQCTRQARPEAHSTSPRLQVNPAHVAPEVRPCSGATSPRLKHPRARHLFKSPPEAALAQAEASPKPCNAPP